MAASPKFKVYDAQGQYQAACHEPEAAAALVAFYGNGSTIRDSHPAKYTVWTEGKDGRAGESYDRVAEVVLERSKL
jgi:hypothetical protein